MKKFYISYTSVIFSLLIIYTSFLFSGCSGDKREVRQVVKSQMELYPASTLQDIYKSFFQDEYGPGHLIGDVSVAREYFDLELEDMVSTGKRKAEPCGTGKNFYRVPMDLVKEGIIPEDEYFECFMESSKGFQEPDMESWVMKWNEIMKEIEAMDLQIPNLARDKKALTKYLMQGEAAVHHSDSYNSHYSPHYRIFSKVQLEKLKASYPGL